MKKNIILTAVILMTAQGICAENKVLSFLVKTWSSVMPKASTIQKAVFEEILSPIKDGFTTFITNRVVWAAQSKAGTAAISLAVGARPRYTLPFVGAVLGHYMLKRQFNNDKKKTSLDDKGKPSFNQRVGATLAGGVTTVCLLRNPKLTIIAALLAGSVYNSDQFVRQFNQGKASVGNFYTRKKNKVWGFFGYTKLIDTAKPSSSKDVDSNESSKAIASAPSIDGQK